MTTADDITRLFRRFNASVEFTDSPSGFFGFLRDLFDKLAKEEEVASRRDGVDGLDYPSFGHKDDDHEDIKIFYAVWSGFATRKTFSWRDKYRASNAEERRMRRLIEKENKRFREEGVREFSDAVRSLVAFVKKRDPRYKANAQSEEERQNALREAAKAQAARQRAANLAKMDEEVLPEWAQRREPDDDVEISDDESEEEHFECMACRKTFKSDKQFEAHEKSKKHIKTVQALKRKLQKEGHDFDLDESDTGTPVELEEPIAGSVFSEVNGEASIDSSTVRISHEQLASSMDKVNIEETNIMDDMDDDANDSDDSSLVDVQVEESVKSDDIESLPSAPAEHPDSPPKPTPKVGKAAQKRAKKATQAAGPGAEGTEHKCASCNASFPSRSRLFQHIKDHGHAAPVPVAKGKASGKKKK